MDFWKGIAFSLFCFFVGKGVAMGKGKKEDAAQSGWLEDYLPIVWFRYATNPTLPKINIAPQNGPFQMEISLPRTNFQRQF